MPLLVPMAVPANQSAQALTGSSSSTPGSPAGESEGGDRGFSSQLQAQQRGEQNKASNVKKEPTSKPAEHAGKPTKTDAMAKNSGSEGGRDSALEGVSGKGGAAGENAIEAYPDILARLEIRVNKGAQNTLAVGVSAPGVEGSMGERVLSLLAANNDVDSSESSSASETPIDAPSIVVSGNVSPHADQTLPQQLAGSASMEIVEADPVSFVIGSAEHSLLPVDGEILPEAGQSIPSEIKPSSEAAALHQDGVLKAGGPGTSNPELVSPAQSGELLARPNSVLPSVGHDMSRTFANKQLAESNPVAGVDADPDALLDLRKSIKPALSESSAAKLPAISQAGVDTLANVSGAKDSFEQVRQNIVAAAAGKSELLSPVNVALSGGGQETSETLPQGLNSSNFSSTLAMPGTEPAKYTATQELAPQRFFTLQTPAGQPGWDVELGNRIRWMVGQNNSGVELRLNPPELGSIEVKLATDGERTSITFFSTNPAARDVLEAALPRLREMFADSGMQLANADVSERGLQQEREQLSSAERFEADRDEGEAMLLETGVELASIASDEGRGVIDYYI